MYQANFGFTVWAAQIGDAAGINSERETTGTGVMKQAASARRRGFSPAAAGNTREFCGRRDPPKKVHHSVRPPERKQVVLFVFPDARSLLSISSIYTF
jgi:hypothetical protein